MIQLLEFNLLGTALLLIGGWVVLHNIKREVARIGCELTGHCTATLERKYQEQVLCPRCEDVIAVRAIESEGDGMQSHNDTIHQRLSHIEQALGLESLSAAQSKRLSSANAQPTAICRIVLRSRESSRGVSHGVC